MLAAADIEKINVATHSSNFPECKTWCTDLSSASGTQFRKETGIGDRHIDALFSGPPCQGFSLIGKRSQQDPRNLLVFDLARLIGELLPSYFVMENVEGILLGLRLVELRRIRQQLEVRLGMRNVLLERKFGQRAMLHVPDIGTKEAAGSPSFEGAGPGRPDVFRPLAIRSRRSRPTSGPSAPGLWEPMTTVSPGHDDLPLERRQLAVRFRLHRTSGATCPASARPPHQRCGPSATT